MKQPNDPFINNKNNASLSAPDLEILLTILRPLLSEDRRRELVRQALYEEDLVYYLVEFHGSTHDFCIRLIDHLIYYGCLINFLETIRKFTGLDNQYLLDAIIENFKVAKSPIQGRNTYKPTLSNLVETFSALDSMRTPSGRNDIVKGLPPEIGNRIHRRSAANGDIKNIISKCLEFEQGLQILFEVVLDAEGETKTITKIRGMLNIS